MGIWHKVCCCLAVAVALNASAVTLKVDKVQQRYPWNGLVDIDYTITNPDNVVFGPDDNLEVMMIDKSVTPVVTNRAITFLQVPLPMAEGRHRITWNANADGVTNYSSRAVVRVKIVHYAPAYMVIDVSGGPETNMYPVTFLNGEPVGGFNVPVYKKDKIVLRRIRPGSYMAGSPSSPAEANRGSNEAQHRVTLSKPFYIGIFQVTQKQYANVMNEDPSGNKGEDRPVEKVTYTNVRGSSNSSVSPNSFMGKLVAKCKAWNPQSQQYDTPVEGFDLPTEFQWEYACRAGTTGAFSTTNTYDNTKAQEQIEQLNLLGRYNGNQADGRGGIDSTHTVVGSYNPNAWGLYDMHGNVWEWCRDWYDAKVEQLGQYVDPVGPSKGTTRVIRGGCWTHGPNYCRSACRNDNTPNVIYDYYGFRLCRTLP